MSTILIRGGTLITMNPTREILTGDILVRGNRIEALGTIPQGERPGKIIEAGGRFILPGFVQGHIHLCQTLFRNRAEDLALLDWLQQWIWPLEASHTPDTLRASVRLGLYELIDSGVTTVLDMGTVRHTEVIFEELFASGIRGLGGKAMMDSDGEGIVPLGLLAKTKTVLDESLELLRTWHGQGNGRIQYAFAPRFALSCTRECLEEVGRLSRKEKAVVHTHGSENRVEVELVKRITGSSNMAFLHEVGLAKNRLCVAHAVHLVDEEMDLMRASNLGVLHCPGSNLKLASGISPVPRLRRMGIPVALGSDGAPCNNRLDIFREMFLAGSLQKVKHGPEALSAGNILEMATIEGAEALGLDQEIGSLEPGKKADLAVINLDFPWTVPLSDPLAALVYAADPRNVETVVCDGRVLKEGGILTGLDRSQVTAEAKNAWQTLAR